MKKSSKQRSRLNIKEAFVICAGILAVIISFVVTIIIASQIVSTGAQAETISCKQDETESRTRSIPITNVSETTTKQAALEETTTLKNVNEAESEKVKNLPKTQAKSFVEITPNNACKLVSLGTFIATAYCPCKQCSGGYGNGTSTGTVATAGRTIAVDPSVIPYGSEVIINGHTYVAEDCGGAIKGNRIDIFFNTHEEAEQFGRQKVSVEIKNKR